MRESEAREGKPGFHNYTCGTAINSCPLTKAALAETLSEHHVCSKTWPQTYHWLGRERVSTKIDYFFLAGFASIWDCRAGKSLNSHSRDLISQCEGLGCRVKRSTSHPSAVTPPGAHKLQQVGRSFSWVETSCPAAYLE